MSTLTQGTQPPILTQRSVSNVRLEAILLGQQNLVNSDCLSGGGGRDIWQNPPSHLHACRTNAVVKDQAGPDASFKSERRPCHRHRGQCVRTLGAGVGTHCRRQTYGVQNTHQTWDQVADCLLTQWNKTKGGQDVRGSGNILPNSLEKWLYHYSLVWKNKSSSELGGGSVSCCAG